MKRTTGRVRIAFLLLVASAVHAGGTAAPAQETVEGPRLRVSVAEIALDGRVQTQFNTTSVDSVPASELLLRRVYLGVGVKVNDVVSGKVQADFARNRVVLKDAYLKLTFSPAFEVLAGNAYRPFSLLTQTSDTRILPIERGVRIRGLEAIEEQDFVEGLGYGDRDIGLQVMGAPTGAPLDFAFTAGVFQGPLHQRVGAKDSYQFAARATVSPMKSLTLGAGWSSRDFARFRAPGDPSPELERGHGFEVDLEYGTFSPGPHVMGEVVFGDSDPFRDRSFTGAQLWLGYRTERVSPVLAHLEPIVRISYGNLSSGRGLTLPADPGGTLLTPGINLYFGGLNRLMLNYDLWLPADDGDRESSFKAMFQLAF